jgi:UDP-N-acetylmuramoylalanine--D-glutamate ligase
MMTNIKGKKVLVLGLGRSGRAAISLLLKAGALKIVANDCKEISLVEKEMADHLKRPQLELVAGGHPGSLLEDVGCIIKSPGIKPQLPLLKKAILQAIPIYSEIELAYHFSRAPIFAVTGTNGKTTTASLVGAMFKERFPNVLVAGNIGFPLSEAVLRASQNDVIIAELSSFQLENIENFRPKIAAVLNITPDHLDYHESADNYIAAKKKIFLNQQAGDWAVLNWNDQAVVSHFLPLVKGNLLPFSSSKKLNPGICLQDGKIAINFKAESHLVCRPEEVRIPGLHNLENARAAVAISWAGGTGVSQIARALKNFPGVPHRLEQVAKVAGVSFVNDSKGTNPDATIKALHAIGGPKILIAGGFDKKIDFKPMFQEMKKMKVRGLFFLGETAPLLSAMAREGGFREATIVSGLEEAVKRAFAASLPGDTVLLSPACASWDMFADFEERGHKFKEAVAALKEGLGGEKNPGGT